MIPYLPSEPNTVLSIARVLATPVEAPRPPWVSVSTGIGGAVGWLFGEVQLAATPPTSEFGPGHVLRLLLGGRP